MCDYIIVGCGFTGSVIARKLAEEKNKKVLILERRNRIAGNMYDELDKNGILVQKYGPHVFHTDNKKVYNFVTRFSTMQDYSVMAHVCIDGKILPSPFNFTAIDTFYPLEKAELLKQKLKNAYGDRKVVTVIELLKNADPDICAYAELLFEKDYRPYTTKQWGLSPEQIDVSILERCPVFLSYRKKYLKETFECLPEGGFTRLFEKMLDHPNITVKLGVDAANVIDVNTHTGEVLYESKPISTPVVYTGALDELLHYKFGQLPYRSLRFDYQTFDQESYQDVAIVTYPQAKDYTRITEYTKLPAQTNQKTVVAIEYPVSFVKDSDEKTEPYYPIINQKNNELYAAYYNEVCRVKQLIVCGRLGDYKYYNMDQAVVRAIEVADSLD